MTVPVILIVDDEKRLRDLVEQYLTQAGFRVFQATDGVTALTQARILHPDLIILDLMLPGLDVLRYAVTCVPFLMPIS
jgi:Response regulators consisting of a CheY-like receiver domain and a winged-helix DNA-binding domain